MRFLDAARRVLEAAKRPMTSRAIATEALRLGMIETTGKTPHRTMDAALYVAAKEGGSGIVRLGEPGMVRSKRGTVRWALAKE